MSSIKVSQLAIYPVKSLRQVSLDASEVDHFGLHNDRRWMVVDQNGNYITQRKVARMCLIDAFVIDDQLSLSAPGMSDISVAKPTIDTILQVTVWDDQCNAFDCGGEIASWLSQFLQIECRLVFFPDNEIRIVDQTYAQENDRTAFSDGFPILLISEASLDDLNSKLDSPVSMARFRPNLVVKGCDAFAEDDWKLIKIGDLTMRVVKPCSRCVIPSIDIETAEKGSEPTRTLSSYRRRDNKIFFGQNVIANGVGRIEVGMDVEILE